MESEKLHARGWKLDARGWMLDARSWKLDARSWKLDVRSWMFDVRNWKLDVRGWRLDDRGWTLGARSWKLDARTSNFYSLPANFYFPTSNFYSLTSNFYSLTSNFFSLSSNIYLLLSLFCLISISSNAQTLESYQKQAAENNPGLEASYKQFEAAMERTSQVGSLSDPTLSFGYFISPVETRVGPQRAKVSLSQMFPWFGTLKARENQAALLAEAKYQVFLEERDKLYFKVAQAYYPLYELEQKISLEEGNIEILESYIRIATSKFENGNGPMVDVLRVDIMLNDSKTNLEILKMKRKPLLAEFNQLLNRDNNEEVEIVDSLSVEELPENYHRDSLLANNPTIDKFDLQMQASEAGEEVARKQGLPKMGVGLDYVLVEERSNFDASNNGQDAFMPMVSLSIPIFRGQYKAARKEAQLMRESYELQKEDYTNSLTANYEMAWFEIEQQRELLELYEKQVQETEQSLNLLYSAYGNSGNEFEEVLRMQQQLLKYEKMKATALTQYHIAMAKLEYLF